MFEMFSISPIPKEGMDTMGGVGTMPEHSLTSEKLSPFYFPSVHCNFNFKTTICECGFIKHVTLGDIYSAEFPKRGWKNKQTKKTSAVDMHAIYDSLFDKVPTVILQKLDDEEAVLTPANYTPDKFPIFNFDSSSDNDMEINSCHSTRSERGLRCDKSLRKASRMLGKRRMAQSLCSHQSIFRKSVQNYSESSDAEEEEYVFNRATSVTPPPPLLGPFYAQYCPVKDIPSNPPCLIAKKQGIVRNKIQAVKKTNHYINGRKRTFQEIRNTICSIPNHPAFHANTYKPLTKRINEKLDNNQIPGDIIHHIHKIPKRVGPNLCNKLRKYKNMQQSKNYGFAKKNSQLPKSSSINPRTYSKPKAVNLESSPELAQRSNVDESFSSSNPSIGEEIDKFLRELFNSPTLTAVLQKKKVSASCVDSQVETFHQTMDNGSIIHLMSGNPIQRINAYGDCSNDSGNIVPIPAAGSGTASAALESVKYLETVNTTSVIISHSTLPKITSRPQNQEPKRVPVIVANPARIIQNHFNSTDSSTNVTVCGNATATTNIPFRRRYPVLLGGRCKPVLEAVLNGCEPQIALILPEKARIIAAIKTCFQRRSAGETLDFLPLLNIPPNISDFIMASVNYTLSPHPAYLGSLSDYWECVRYVDNWIDFHQRKVDETY